jgi:hypothetical protein
VLAEERMNGERSTIMRARLSDGTRLVFKYAVAGGILRNEANVYDNIRDSMSRIPVFYGLFSDGNWDVIIQSDEGDSLRNFDMLTPGAK